MKNNLLKRSGAAVVLVCILVLALAGCSGGAGGANPDAVVNAYWDAMMKGDSEAAAAMVVAGQEAELGVLEEDMFGGEEGMEEFGEAFMERFDIKATGYDIDGDTATVDVTVTIPDLSAVFAAYLEEAMSTMMDMAMNGATDEEMQETIQKALMDALDDADDLTFDETAALQKVDGEWKISSWDFSGLESSMDGIMQDFTDSMME